MPNPEIAPALVERAIALVRAVAAGPGFSVDEARAIVAELPAPVDPDAERKEMEEIRKRYQAKRMFVSPLADHDASVAWFVLDEIKRVRQQEKG